MGRAEGQRTEAGFVQVGGQGLPLCVALGMKGGSPAGQPQQALDQPL